ncbi:unnamed protein product [Owenia fusiformis]|uniref:Uncharacterized protein n=1 Tax=Owenia fusiformis TaxID=6347 RepID=A0A8J1TK31_OWEFU|nr:unnamed protein product [Owenia fusiformis]
MKKTIISLIGLLFITNICFHLFIWTGIVAKHERKNHQAMARMQIKYADWKASENITQGGGISSAARISIFGTKVNGYKSGKSKFPALQTLQSTSNNFSGVSSAILSEVAHRSNIESYKIHNKLNPTVVIYNRVPKCASTYMQTLLQIASKYFGYSVIKSKDYHTWHLNNKQIKEFIKKIKTLTTETYPGKDNQIVPLKYIYNRHLYYVDFSHFGKHQPMYINIIRDPFEQARSLYYFNRLQGHYSRLPGKYTEYQKNLTFEQCVSENMEELKNCDVDTELYVKWFCGHDSKCFMDIDYAIGKAKKHIDTHILIGLTEDLPNTLKAMEKLLPTFFPTISEIYMRNKIRNSGNGSLNDIPSTEFVEMMKNKLVYSYEIYTYVKLKFYRTLKELKII